MSTRISRLLRGRGLSKKLWICTLLAITVFSIFYSVHFVHPVEEGPGTHRVHVIFYQAYIYYDHDIFDAGEWYFRLATPTALTEQVGPYSADNEEMVDFIDRSASWLFSNEIRYWCEAREEDFGEWEEFEYPVRINDPWKLSTNIWHERSTEFGGVVHYYSKFLIENKRPTVSAIEGPFSGYKGIEYTWTTTGSDPEGDSLGWYYWYVDEDLKQDGSSNSFTYEFPTDAPVGDHIISVRVKDYFGSFSNYKYKLFTINEGDPPEYTLIVNTVGNGSVNLNPLPDAGVYDEGTLIQVTASPESGWMFSGWGGDLSGSDNPESITIDEDKIITATFTEIPHAIIPPPLTRVTDWPMYQYDLARSGKTTANGPNTNSTLWTYSTGSPIISSPAVVNGKIYFGSYGKIICLDASTGNNLWNYTSDRGFGGVSSPAVYDGRVYTGHDYRLYCLDATTGNHLWSERTGGNINTSPLVTAGRVYFGSWDDWFYCFDATTGLVDWKYKTGYDIVGSSAAFADGRVYVGSMDAKLYCFDATTGTLLWNYTTLGFPAPYVYSSPTISDGQVYYGSNNRNVYCLNATTGAFIWSLPTSDMIYSSPAVSDNRVYIGSGDHDKNTISVRPSIAQRLNPILQEVEIHLSQSSCHPSCRQCVAIV